MNDHTAQDPQKNSASYVDDYVPPTPDSKLEDVPLNSSQPVSSASDQQDVPVQDLSDEDIEAQNIFDMLGVANGSEDLKEKFLDQLQEVIWDDFLKNDVQLLLSESENAEFKKFQEKVDSAQEGDAKEKAKDEMVEYLEKLIPDLEEIMLEKALDLKADLFVERISGLKEYFAEKQEQLSKVDEAEKLMFEDKWKSAAETLNAIQE